MRVLRDHRRGGGRRRGQQVRQSGQGVALFLPGAVFCPGDALFLLCALLLAGCGLLCRRRAEDLRTREL